MDRIFRTSLLWFALLLPAGGAMGTSQPDATELLAQAESIRSAEPARFSALIDVLQKRRSELEPRQIEQLAYLEIYRLGFGGNYDAVIPRLKELIKSAQDSDIRFRANALLVNVYTKTRRFAESLRQLGAILPQLDQVKDPQLRVHALVEAAYLHNEIGQYPLGLQYAERILAEHPDSRARCFAEYLRFDAMRNMATLPEDKTPLQAAIAHCEDGGERLLANHIRVIVATAMASENKRADAINLLRSHLAEVESLRYPYLAVLVKATLAELLFERGELSPAESYASEAIALSGSVGASTQSLVSAYRTMYRIAERRRDTETALVYYRRYAEADKAYLNEVKTRELAYQIVRQETFEKSEQIQRLGSQNQLLQLQRKLETKSVQNTRLVVVLLVMLLASIGYWAYRTKRTQMMFKRLAQTDALTGIGNRSHFSHQSERLLAQCARNGQEVALVMFDLDHFKTINDRYGHAVGDQVLVRVAELCRRMEHRNSVVGRLGGEEFALLLPDMDLARATEVAEDCRQRISDIDTSATGHRFQVTASFGVTTTALAGYPIARLFSLADRMLYRSKHEGRNQVSAYEGGYSLPERRSGGPETAHADASRWETQGQEA
nr:GGDEF domain-containing protein [Pseudoxanthomonas sp.]